jgi:hemerythrin-like domain-containing protein
MNHVIHAAVRRDLARLEGALERSGDGDAGRASALALAYANLHRQLQHHHQSEDRFIYPFVGRVAPAPDLLKAMNDEHHTMADALAETRVAMDVYASTASAADAKSARDSLTRTHAIVEQHLTHEEDEFEPKVWPYLKTAEWKAVEKQTRPPSLADAGCFFAWLQDGIADEDRTYLRSTIPPPVTFLLSRLGGRAYYRDIAPVWKHSSRDSAQPVTRHG